MRRSEPSDGLAEAASGPTHRDRIASFGRGGGGVGTVLGLSVLSGLYHLVPTSGLVQGDWPISAILEALFTFLMAALGAAWPAMRVTAERPAEALLGR